MIDDNISFLKKTNPFLANLITHARATRDNTRYRLETTKSGHPTLVVEKNDHKFYLHSKYDPVNEANAFLDGIDASELDDIDTIVFFGVGLGYHIVEFAKRFRDKYIILFEPDATIMTFFMESVDLGNLNRKRLKKIYVGGLIDINALLADLFNHTYDKITFITWPASERLMDDGFQKFIEAFKMNVRFAAMNRVTINAFQKRWIINSFINLSKNISNKDIFDIDRAHTFNKPALIVAAGPSLDYELDNLRHIIANDLAYVFAVGSAIKSLYAHGIRPHATITMDPDESTQATYFEMIADEDFSTPLIYGTSVGFETLSSYRAKQYYMVMDRDTVSQLFIKKKDGPLKIFNDAPSIAVTTTQLLSELGFSPIIFVGQNLAYIENRNYASGIKYGNIGLMQERDHTLTANEERNKVEINSVDGEMVFTNSSYVAMKRTIETIIARYPDLKYINTTKHGAAIDGAPYMEMERVIEENLCGPAYNSQWLESIHTDLDKDYLSKKITDFAKSSALAKKCISNSIKLLQELEKCVLSTNRQPVGAIIDAIYKNIALLSKSDIYKSVLAPINMLEITSFREKLSSIGGSRTFSETMNNFIATYGRYLLGLDKDLTFIVDDLSKHILAEIKGTINA